MHDWYSVYSALFILQNNQKKGIKRLKLVNRELS